MAYISNETQSNFYPSLPTLSLHDNLENKSLLRYVRNITTSNARQRIHNLEKADDCQALMNSNIYIPTANKDDFLIGSIFIHPNATKQDECKSCDDDKNHPQSSSIAVNISQKYNNKKNNKPLMILVNNNHNSNQLNDGIINIPLCQQCSDDKIKFQIKRRYDNYHYKYDYFLTIPDVSEEKEEDVAASYMRCNQRIQLNDEYLVQNKIYKINFYDTISFFFTNKQGEEWKYIQLNFVAVFRDDPALKGSSARSDINQQSSINKIRETFDKYFTKIEMKIFHANHQQNDAINTKYRTVYIAKLLPVQATETSALIEDLSQFCKQHGAIPLQFDLFDRYYGEFLEAQFLSRFLFAFVTVANPRQASSLITLGNGKLFRNIPLELSIAKHNKGDRKKIQLQKWRHQLATYNMDQIEECNNNNNLFILPHLESEPSLKNITAFQTIPPTFDTNNIYWIRDALYKLKWYNLIIKMNEFVSDNKPDEGQKPSKYQQKSNNNQYDHHLWHQINNIFKSNKEYLNHHIQKAHQEECRPFSHCFDYYYKKKMEMRERYNKFIKMLEYAISK